MWGGEAHLAVDVVLSPSITALTPPGPYFCMLVFAPLKPFGMDKHLPLPGNVYFTCLIVEVRPSLTCLGFV